jgi:hypothetical protein
MLRSVGADNLFLVSAIAVDTICEIQKIEHLWCRPIWTNTKHWNFGVGCLCQPTRKISFLKKLLSLDLVPWHLDPSSPSSGCRLSMPLLCHCRPVVVLWKPTLCHRDAMEAIAAPWKLTLWCAIVVPTPAAMRPSCTGPGGVVMLLQRSRRRGRHATWADAMGGCRDSGAVAPCRP